MYQITKRIIDFVLSLAALIVLAPVLVIILIWIRLSSKGPAVFRQERAGKNGKPFTLFKFRTMRTDVDPFGPSPKGGDDQRLTRVGKLLREYSLDELPQLLNVLSGEMSLVGPRPLYVAQIAEWNENQKRRLLVKPGLTGLAQVSGRGAITIEEKLDLDVQYVERASMRLDLKIIWATIVQVLGKKSIYEKQYSRTQETRKQV